MTIQDLVPQATENLVHHLRGKGFKVEIGEFNANALRAYYSCAHLSDSDLTNEPELVYFEPMAINVGRGAEQEGWKDVIVCVTVEGIDDEECIVFNVIDRATFEKR